MYKLKERIIPLSEEDEIVMRLGFLSLGNLTEVSLQYRAIIKGVWRDVARYDNAHGVPHRYRLWRSRGETRLPMAVTPKRLAELATADFKANWKTYRRRMEAVLE